MAKRFYIFFLIISILFISCQKTIISRNPDILPQKISVPIPHSLSANIQIDEKGGVANVPFTGRNVYRYLRRFIYNSEKAVNLIDKQLKYLSNYNIAQNYSLTVSGQDDRPKYIEIKTNQFFDGQNWQYSLKITDLQTETEKPDSSLAMLMYWNLNPTKVCAIVFPFNIDRKKFYNSKNTVIRLDYTQKPNIKSRYDEVMTVWITKHPVNPLRRFSMQNLKIVFAKKGTRIDIYGNTSHPYAWLLLQRDTPGINWAFIASAEISKHLAVAKIGLPPNYINTDNRTIILDSFSVYNVLKSEYKQWFLERFGYSPPQDSVTKFLNQAMAPGFYNSDGFIQAGHSPNSNYDFLISNLQYLSPFNPYQISNLQIRLDALF